MPPDALDPPNPLSPVNPRGIWDRVAIYQRGDLVTWEGSSYIAATENIGSEPIWYSPVWQVVAEKGEPGLSLRPRGQWSRTTIYEPRDVVSYSGESWLAIKPSIGVVPYEGIYWQILARQGQPGMGGPGARGETGATGPAGPPGVAGGVDVEEDNVVVGAATTLDFGNGLDVSLVGAEADIVVDESELDHALFGNVNPDDHHAESHSHASHSGIGANDHHTEDHGVAEHSSAVTIRDEGVGQGDVTVLDFIGAGITAAVAGGVASITVTATGGGGDTLVAWVGL